jgi:ribosomal 30S subunit maturation factor RimM
VYKRQTYDSAGKKFTLASPMGQLLQVTLSLGRTILYYIEDSITELNINTASRPDSVKGLSSLTGHNPSRAIAARGTLKLIYNGKQVEMYGNTIVIPNFTQLTSTINGLVYTIVLPGNEVRLDLSSISNYVDVNIMQGKLEYQQATGTGDPLQSYNFQNKKGAGIDNYFVNVYVNGERWEKRDTILDMIYREKSVLVKTGVTGGIDIFFGNGFQGDIPPLGATILVEYLLTDGAGGNLNAPAAATSTNWKFTSPGYALNSTELDLNKMINVSIKNDIILGTLEEPIFLTRLLAPHTSRSFVLANANNYIYFLKKLNMFTIVDALPGFATFEDKFAADKTNAAQKTYDNLNEEYRVTLNSYGSVATKTTTVKAELDNANKQLIYWKGILEEEKQDDNTIYLFLVPDVNKRIASADNYYTTSITNFSLTDAEKEAILDLIEESGQRILTIDNVILKLQHPRFVLNTSLVVFEGFEYSDIREAIISKTSDYFLFNTRRDRLPVSDIVRIIEDIDGVDSVNVWFDADKNNLDIYNDGTYGLDSFGDIILERYVIDAFSNKIPVKDVYPLIRGGFTSYRNIDYEDTTNKSALSNVNIQVRGSTPVDFNTLNNQKIMTNI